MSTVSTQEPGRAVEIVEVGPRDGLQSQPRHVDTDTKVAFIHRLVAAGVRRIEAVSFVNPKRVPQMADADAVIRQLPHNPNVRFIGLVLNTRGFERAVAAGLREINTVVVATEAFSQRNQGMSVAAIMDSVEGIAAEARRAGIFCGVTLSAAFGCPYEGRVDRARVVELARRLIGFGIDEIALADTIGVAVPDQVTALVGALDKVRGAVPLRLHFHNTRNTAIANVQAALQAGVRIFDASCGGVGGCPFAPGATGNVATEDVLFLLENSGYRTGISLPSIIDTTRWLETPLATTLPAAVSRASPFPPAAA
ncbi:MAG: hydroxymethylglutaryl-CoA lyase [Gammaproteobacteria bacterium]